MAIYRFLRRDLIIRLAAEEAGHRIEITERGPLLSLVVPSVTEAPPLEAARRLFASPLVLSVLRQWLNVPAEVGPIPTAEDAGPVHFLKRIGLRIEDERIAPLPLEDALREIIAQAGIFYAPLIVRLEAVPPRVAQVPFTLPLRLLQLDPGGDFHLPDAVRGVFGTRSMNPSIIQAEQARSTQFVHCELPTGWKTVDVLELDDMPSDPERMLLASAPEEVGSLGWLTRCTDLWRTRLVVLRGKGDVAPLRKVAQELTARGGPAVLVVDDSVPGAGNELPGFFARLIHDSPVDAAVADWQGATAPSLVSGGGRAELLRVSSPGQRLANLVRTQRWSGKITPSSAPDAVDLVANLASRLPSLNFDTHEGDGMIPLGEAIDRVRTTAESFLEATGEEPGPAELREPADPDEPRFANIGLWQLEPAGRGAAIVPTGTHLRPDEPVVLGVQIGARRGFEPVLDAVALLEEPFKWSEDKPGVWLSVGITGLDFEVKGIPLQEVWLPRSGASDLVEFVVQPTRPGVNQVRICLYYGADLLQSHRLAAQVGEPAAGQPAAAAIAKALDVGAERVGDAGWLARMEYAAADNLAEPPRGRDVALSIFANDVDGRKIVTVRGAAEYEVEQLTPETTLSANQVRLMLDAVSRNPKAPDYYAFPGGGGLALNAATDDTRDAALKTLATAGYALYQQIFRRTNRENLARELEGDGRIIHIAHSLLEKVIPWAALYDRKYDPNKKEDGGLPALHAVCRAGLPGASGKFAVTACGTHDDCPLSAQGRAKAAGKAVTPDTIVCARHFWGFRHVIELPPYQTDAEAGTTASTPRRETVTQAGRPASMVLGYNEALHTVGEHLQALRDLLSQSKVSGQWTEQKARDAFLAALGPGTDLVYMFCHARDGDADPVAHQPALVFRETGGVPVDAIQPIALDTVMGHHPLVILNGCNTAKFSVDALSPFIRNLVRDCEAAGAIGTEIPVFEQLAGRVAVEFLARFLDGEEAGTALLAVRRQLLGMGNPLGLAYTLYAVAELKLRQTGT